MSIHATTCFKFPPELVENNNSTLLCYNVSVFKRKRSDCSMFWDGHLGRAFHRMQGPMEHLVWGFLLLTCPHTQRCASSLNQTSRKPGLSPISFSNHPHITISLFHVSWCKFMLGLGPVWVQLKILFFFSIFFAKMHLKDPILETSSDRSPHPHSQDILHLPSCQIRKFLPSCWGCLLILWHEISVAKDKFGFSGNKW